MFKGFSDGQNSADLDADGILDGVELWINIVENAGTADWLSVDPACDTIPGLGSMDVVVTFDAVHIWTGEHFSELIIVSNDPDESEVILPVLMKAIERGDANADFGISISDVVYLINYLFKSGSAPDPVESGDVNCDSEVSISDAVYLINYLFKWEQPPCE